MATADEYAIAITLDTSQATPAARSFTAELSKAEQAGARVGEAAGRGMRESSLAADRAAAAHGRLVGGLGRAGLAFEGLTSAIAREQAMLDRINGPARRYEQHLQTLDSLLDRNRISTEQYAREVSRLNVALDKSNRMPMQPAARVATAPAGGSGSLLAAGLGQTAAVAGIGIGAREILAMGSSFQNLQNRMRVVADEGASVSATFDRVRGIATSTRSSIEGTAESYARLRGATREMGLSSEDLLRVTERVSKAIKVSGASAEEAKSVQLQLAQALASGRLQGDEFRSVAENAPYVMQLLSQALGVTTGKLREMASQGKLTSSVVIGAFQQMGTEIDADFAKTAPTLDEQWAQLKDTIMVAVGQFGSATGAFKYIGDVASTVGSVFGVVADASRGLGEIVDFVGGTFGTTGDKLKQFLTPLGLAKTLLDGLRDGAGALGDTWSAAFGIGQDAATQNARAYLVQMESLKRLQAEETKLEETERTLAAARAAGVAVPTFDLESAKIQASIALNLKQTYGIDLPTAYDKATTKGNEMAAAINKLKEQRAAKQLAEDIERATNAATGFNSVLDGTEKRYKAALDKVRDYASALQTQQQQRFLAPSMTISRTDVDVVRGYRDAQIALDATENRYGATVEEVRLKTLRHRDAIEDATGAFRTGQISAGEYAAKLKELGVEEDRATKILREIRKPGLEYTADVQALNLLLAQGRIAFGEYETAIRKATDAYAGSELRGLLEGVRSPKAPKLVSTGDEGDVTRSRFEALQKYQEAVDKATADAEAELARPVMPDLEKDIAAFDAAGASMKAMLDSMKGPTREYNLGLADVGQLLRDGSITSREYEVQIRKLEEAYFGATHAGKNFEDGLARGLHGIRLEIEDVGSAIESTLKNAFKSAEDALVDFVTTGEFNFKKMVDSMLADLTRLLIRQALAGIVGGLGGGGGIASVLGTGATQGFQGLYGSAPGYATGGEGRIGGSGGPDSQLFIARVTPGEHFKFTPPGQPVQAAAVPAPAPEVRVIVLDDESKVRRFMETHGEQYAHVFERRRDSARRGRTTGRG